MFHPLSDKNKFGYYTVGNYNTYSKFDALEIAKQSNQSVTWNFNNEFYNQCQWTKEPDVDLKVLYRNRAQEIRDKYDYVVLMFSGGMDSMHVLHSFIDNGIMLDEICSHTELAGAKNDHNFSTGEIEHSAIPYIKNLYADSLTNTRYRIVDSSEHQLSVFTNLTVDLRQESYYDFNAMQNISSLSKWDIRSAVPDYHRIIESGKKLCLVYGEGKPVIEFDTVINKHRWVFNSHTVCDMICPPKLQKQNHPGYHDEMFYSGDLNILAKQGHLLLKHLRNPTPDMFVDINETPPTIKVKYPHLPDLEILNPILSSVKTYHNNKRLSMKLGIMHQIIYPGIMPPVYNQGKNVQKVFNPRDEWLRVFDPAAAKKWYTGYIQTAMPIGQMTKYAHRNFRTEYYIE